jgi:hypothetical protein
MKWDETGERGISSMKPPDPCEPLEKLVDKLHEQLEALCSQSQEHLFLKGLIDLRGLTEATRAMLKDAEGRLANCRRHPVPPSDRPFLVTLADSNCLCASAEAHQDPARTALWQRVVAYAVLGVLGLSLGYAIHEHRLTQSLATQSEQELASLNATRSQIDSLTATVKALDARPELTLAPVADTPTAHLTASPRHRTLDRRVRQLQWRFNAQGKAIEDTRRNLSATHDDLTSTRTELTGSIARTHGEPALLQRNGEPNYCEFDIGKSKQFQKDGPLGIRLKKADAKHKYADLELLIEDRDLLQKHVNLFETIVFHTPDSLQPVGLVINSISKDHIHGYVSKPGYSQLELASMSNANIPSTPGANQVSTNADAQVRLDRDDARLGFRRHYSSWKASITRETHKISLATVPIREALRRQISAN